MKTKIILPIKKKPFTLHTYGIHRQTHTHIWLTSTTFWAHSYLREPIGGTHNEWIIIKDNILYYCYASYILHYKYKARRQRPTVFKRRLALKERKKNYWK